jgi:hypothetical protein
MRFDVTPRFTEANMRIIDSGPQILSYTNKNLDINTVPTLVEQTQLLARFTVDFIPVRG